MADIQIPSDDLSDERVRMIERGSRLVTVMPSIHSVVLQAPRGNLEAVCPRALVLASVRQNIEKREFRSAFMTCRTHRIDMNILHNHAPELFIENVPLFIQQLNDVEHIDLFLSSLKEPAKRDTEIDSAQTKSVRENAHAISKVSSIADAVLGELVAHYPTTHMQSILTAHLSKLPPDMPSALLVIAKLKDDRSNLVPVAIEHICFLADVNRLYDEALGLYRLDIALLDPREYLPFLRNLNEMPTALSRFTIDDYLKRYNKALVQLSQCRPEKTFNDVLAYIRKHSLYRDAMVLYKDQREQYDAILCIYADYLDDNSQHSDAALAYELVGQNEKAIEAYSKAGLWRECLNVAYTSQMSLPKLQQLAAQLAEDLVERRQFVDAARIYLDYGHDDNAIEQAVSILTKGNLFSEAIRVVNDKLDRASISRLVHPTIIDSFAQTTELISELRAQLNAQVPRLRILRQKKREDPETYFEGSIDDIDMPDDISIVATEASTSASLFTRYTPQSSGSRATRSTSKNRRREERKRARGKKGTIYEEEYLVNSIDRLIQRVENIRGDIQRLVVALMMIHKRFEAGELQSNFAKLVDEIRSCVVEVFSEPVLSMQVRRDGMEETSVVKKVPDVQQFRKSELLV